MRSSTSLALFAASAAAQSMSTGSLGAGSAAIFNPAWELPPTLTLVGSDATATTYKNDCPSSAGVPLSLISQSSASAMITPAPMPRALRARQATSEVPGAPNSTDEDDDICEPYTIKQGPSTWEFHLTDPTPGVWTLDYSCNWEGAMTAADMTCTVTLDGSWAEVTEPITSASVVPSGEFASIEGAIKTVAIVQASQTPLSSGASPSASGSSASGSRASGSAAPTPSTGFAPGRPLPTGAMALVGGAAGVFAAALAL